MNITEEFEREMASWHLQQTVEWSLRTANRVSVYEREQNIFEFKAALDDAAEKFKHAARKINNGKKG